MGNGKDKQVTSNSIHIYLIQNSTISHLFAKQLNMMREELEEGTTLSLDFAKLCKVAKCKSDVLPAVAQDATTGELLIIGYANELALQTARKCGMATFWSTSRNELWIKGKTSGDYLKIEEIRVNCEQNSILYLVTPAGKGSCHTKDSVGAARAGCYYRRIREDGSLEFVNPLHSWQR